MVPPSFLQLNTGTTRSPRSLPVIIGAAILPFFVGMVLVYYILTQIAGMSLATGFAAEYITLLKSIVASFDFLIIGTFGVMFTVVLIRSNRVRSSPLMAAVGLLSLPVIVVSAAYLGDLASFFTGLQVLGPALNQFPATITFFRNIAPIVAVLSVLVLLVMVGGGLLARR